MAINSLKKSWQESPYSWSTSKNAPPKTSSKSFDIPVDFVKAINLVKGDSYTIEGDKITFRSTGYPIYSSSQQQYTETEYVYGPTKTYIDWPGNGPLGSGDRLISKRNLPDGRVEWKYQEKVAQTVTKYRTVYRPVYDYSVELEYATNTVPTISGSDTDLGTKSGNFDVEYIVSDPDEDDVVNVSIYVNNDLVYGPVDTTVNIRRTFTVETGNLELGEHTVRIVAKDKEEESSERVYTFNISNSAPVISGQDSNLGNKNTAFSIKYQVHDENNDQINVIEKFNGKVIRNLNNPTQRQDITFTVTDEVLKELPVGQINTIEVSADDGKGGLVYRRWTFTRSNLAPIISGSDRDLGIINSFSLSYSMYDLEKDEIKFTTYLDGKVYDKQKVAVDSQEYTTNIDGFEFLSLNPGRHTFKIVAVDSNGLQSERIVTFSRDISKLVMKLKEPIETDIASKKILVTPGWEVAPGAIAKVEVCNNAFDESPTWEDATSMVEASKSYNFQNTTKTDSKWGIDIRLTVERGEATRYSYITGIAGAFE